MQQLNPKYVWLFFIQLVLIWLIFFVGAAFFIEEIFSGDEVLPSDARKALTNFAQSSLWFIVPILIALYVWARLSYHYYRYTLAEEGFKKEYGVISKKYVTIPYSRIQNVDIYRGIWARILGLSDLHIQTAGMSAVVGRYGARGAGAEGRLPGLSKQVAEQLRDELVQRARSPHPTSGL